MPSILRRSQLLRDGFTRASCGSCSATASCTPIRPGAYAREALPRAPEELHLVRVRAALADVAAESVVSHVSAAVVHGLPVWGPDLRLVHLTRPRSTGARRGSATHSHGAVLAADEIDCAGVPVTSPARTVCDLARRAPWEQAVAVADARPARRVGHTRRAE